MRTIKTKLPDGRVVKTATDSRDVRYCRVKLFNNDGSIEDYGGPWPNGIAREKHREAVQAQKTTRRATTTGPRRGSKARIKRKEQHQNERDHSQGVRVR